MKWISTFLPGTGLGNKPIISVIAKKTFRIKHGEEPDCNCEQIGLFTNDIFEDQQNPQFSETVAESDLTAYKPSTDFIVKAKAWPPHNKRAYHIDCEVTAGPCRKKIRVYGKRNVRAKALSGLVISDPEPFRGIDIAYKNAYGGTSLSKDGTPYSFYPNPIGRGFTLKGSFSDPGEISLPNLEDPGSPLTPENLVFGKYDRWPFAPKPASFGWTRKNFYPRYTLSGLLPEHLKGAAKNLGSAGGNYPALKKNRLPEMDPGFFQGASEGLYGKRFKGNERIRLTHMDPDTPVFEFSLPGDIPAITLDIGSGTRELEPELDTVSVDMNKKLLYMVWRGSIEYGGIEELAEMPELKTEVTDSGLALT